VLSLVNMSSDSELLLRYARDRCEDAFAELVRTHIDLVYSAAARRVGGDAHAAMEVTQEVFLSMSRHAQSLARHPVLNAWLHTSTRNAAANFRRREYRNERKKQQMQAMQELPSYHENSPDWESIRGFLDEALDELNEQDRQAIILRYLEGHSYPEISGILGLRDEAVRMRVGRALEKLRGLLERRGAVSTATILGGALSTHAVMGAPAGLAASVSTSVTAATSALSVTTPVIVAFHYMSMTKLSAIIIGIAAAVSIAALSYHHVTKSSDLVSPAVAPITHVSPVRETDDTLNKGLSSIVSDHRARDATRISAGTIEAEEKIAALRDVLVRLPEQSIPELKLATNGDWHSAVDGNLETTDDYRRALGKIRSSAERRFAALLQPALREYLSANREQFPTDTSQLQAFVGAEIDSTMLQRYKVVPSSEVPNVRMGGDWMITQKNLIDSEYDYHSVIGPRGSGTTNVSPSYIRDIELLKPAIKAYEAVHGKRHADLSQLSPYVTSPEQRLAIERLAKKVK
jgi:RNA polymerase sigma factor (sigma-70 family)